MMKQNITSHLIVISQNTENLSINERLTLTITLRVVFDRPASIRSVRLVTSSSYKRISLSILAAPQFLSGITSMWQEGGRIWHYSHTKTNLYTTGQPTFWQLIKCTLFEDPVRQFDTRQLLTCVDNLDGSYRPWSSLEVMMVRSKTNGRLA